MSNDAVLLISQQQIIRLRNSVIFIMIIIIHLHKNDIYFVEQFAENKYWDDCVSNLRGRSKCSFDAT